jgi:hypothetical protein
MRETNVLLLQMPQIIQKFRCRSDARHQQVISGTRAGNVE